MAPKAMPCSSSRTTFRLSRSGPPSLHGCERSCQAASCCFACQSLCRWQIQNFSDLLAAASESPEVYPMSASSCRASCKSIQFQLVIGTYGLEDLQAAIPLLILRPHGNQDWLGGSEQACWVTCSLHPVRQLCKAGAADYACAVTLTILPRLRAKVLS